ncbi:ABC transporter ATP-binding protein [Paenibacillus alginolyticus]|uniref:ABC transporter ATP-binding protein n=1 Tax=Paenibacillus alginolyticus TaxID=59839 RepID=A0ABT4G962_9BACL|nr:ABC transporter ATP-binding protein [Paenibacillus alginolyticus]MCY9692721.1 ABC transporter ATP-binding protein [Paenibacillus alginolyticus]MEC0146378.1 ABC transporter ATP-binding protein [Paenibacillus alginolyticus]
MIKVENLSQSFREQQVLEDISFEIKQGEFFGIIGPNGSGKSTLLRLLSGIDPVKNGRVDLGGRLVSSYSRKELAKWLAVLQQDALPPVGFTVREVVEMGRYPFQNWLGEEPADAEGLIDGIVRKLHLEPLIDRTIERLSGGERQRVSLAKVMAQQPRLLMLDEPTTFLDIGYQVQMMDYIKEWQRESELTVVAVLHDLNLAAQYCTRLMVVHNGKLAAIGTPDEIITSGLISEVYGTEPIVLQHPVNDAPQILLQPGK